MVTNRKRNFAKESLTRKDENLIEGSTEATERLEKGYAQHGSKGLERNETNPFAPTISPLE
jgi:hypothetical protein